MEHIENTTESLAESAGDLTVDRIASLEAAAIPSILEFEPVQLARRLDGWYPERQRAFIEELADCGIVREAAARVGMTERSARRLRLRPDAAAFNLAWDAAVRAGAERLHSIAYERAVNGTVRPRFYKGEQIAEERVYDNRLLIYLLGRVDARHRDRNPEYRLREWEAWLTAVEDGLEKPMPEPDESHLSPVWRDEDGRWLTNFPPPEGFDGEQWYDDDEEDYYRELTAQEQEAIGAWEARPGTKGARRRDVYFRRLTEVPPRR
jgi:hypothetical protein